MNDIKSIIAKNIASLRQAADMTQNDLAEKLNYSDKAVSKWERAESTPDISVLLEIADIFSVPLDYLVREGHEASPPKAPQRAEAKYNHTIITCLSMMVVWFLALSAFVLMSLITPDIGGKWLAFIHAIPACMIIWLVFNSIWFNTRRNYLIISLLMWSVLVSIHTSFLVAGINIWVIYLFGVPGQITILMWSMIKKTKKKK